MEGHEIAAGRTAQLAADYAAAHYFVTIGHKEWLFGVGQHAADIERQLGGSSYLFITAWNPAPAAATLAENQLADERLQARLREGGFIHHGSLGCNAQGGAVEHGWLVLDMPLPAADALARAHGQAATLHWLRGEPVRLRMLWERPAGSADAPHTDWAG